MKPTCAARTRVKLKRLAQCPPLQGLVHLPGLERFDLECLDELEVFGIGGNDGQFAFDSGGGDERIG